MNTLLNILFGFFILMFSGVAITLVGGWLVLQLFGDKEKDDCGCNSCDCDDDDLIPMLDRPLTKEELKEVNMKPKINNKNANNMFNNVFISIISICFCYFLQ